MYGALKPGTLSTVLHWIAEKARSAEFRYWTLAHHITEELLEKSFQRLNKKAAPGIDGQTAKQYEENLKINIRNLHQRLKEQRYRAPSVKRVWIPKGSGTGQRPLGLPTLEDKIVQRAVVTLLEGIYEKDFYDFSYGYRPGRSCHQAIDTLWHNTMKGMRWIIDADISDYFTSIDHAKLKEFLGKRIEDKSIHRLIGKWLKAGVLEDEQLSFPERGTPQGGVVSPLLANIYLHHVLDEWFVKVVTPRLKGRAYLIRVADDFVIGCDYEEDAKRIMEVLPKRMTKYGLTIHPEKTKLLNFSAPKADNQKGHSTFDFVGFKHYWGKSQKGNWVVKRKTAKQRLKRTMRAVTEWCRENRHRPVTEQRAVLSSKLIGHYNYYGITGNCRSLDNVLYLVRRLWHKWLNRRGGRYIPWTVFEDYLNSWLSLPLPRIVHSATLRTGMYAK